MHSVHKRKIFFGWVRTGKRHKNTQGSNGGLFVFLEQAVAVLVSRRVEATAQACIQVVVLPNIVKSEQHAKGYTDGRKEGGESGCVYV